MGTVPAVALTVRTSGAQRGSAQPPRFTNGEAVSQSLVEQISHPSGISFDTPPPTALSPLTRRSNHATHHRTRDELDTAASHPNHHTAPPAGNNSLWSYGYRPSFERTRRVTSPPSARPFVARMTWPMITPIGFMSPERRRSAMSGLAASAESTAASSS